jgi:bifunctional DNase/RNase
MSKDFVQVTFDRIIQTRVYTAIVLKSTAVRFAIFSDHTVGKFLQSHLSGDERIRPQTHDLVSTLLQAFDVRVKQVVINDVKESTFFARLFLEMEKDQMRHIVEIDARPSDCIILAFLHNAPVFCVKEVIDKVIPFVE